MTDISVIIPTYNRARQLEPALESVLGQSLLPAEIIIVDDGSTDGTREFVADYRKHTELNIVSLQQSNKGPAAARNRGIDAARGSYLAFLDSDDWWHRDKLKLQYRAMQSGPQFLVSHTCERWLRNNEHLNQKKQHIPAHGDLYRQSLRLCCVGMSTVMARRKLFERYGSFDETLRCCEDYDLWLRVSPFEPFLLIDKPLTVKHGGRSDQVSHQFRIGMDRFRIQALAKLVRTSQISTEQMRQAVAELIRRCLIYGNGCLKHGKHTEAAYYLRLAEHFSASNEPSV
ncbi:MAG: glycosyltransferase family A protein [Desulfofustis sp.]|jgi:glycosyltransferase involved in cell wall biosynthesis